MGERILSVGGNKASRPIEDLWYAPKPLEWYVGPNAKDDGDDARSGRSKETSLASLDAAIDLAVASADSYNDVIHVLPGHAETVSSAGMINLDKIGLQVICHGTGALRPTFTFSLAAATILITAASCSMTNFIMIPSADAIISGIVVSAANCKLDFEVQDANDIEFITAVLTTAGADNLDIDMKYLGDIGGDECLAPIQLVGVDTARINVDFYGVADTAVVNFITTACLNIDIKGLFNNVGTALTKSVVDTEGNGSWSVRGWDGVNNATFSGGDNAAIASDDITAVAAAVAVIDGLHDVPTANASPDLYIRDVVGRKTDTAVGTVAAVNSLMAYLKGVLEDTTVIGALGAGLTDITDNTDEIGALGVGLTAITDDTNKIDGVTLLTAPVAASLASFIASGGTSLGTQLPASFSLADMVRGKSVTRAAEDILDGTQSTLFTVAGGRVLLLGLVAEVSVAAVDATPSATSFVTNPTVGTDMAMCATLDVNAHENGSMYSITGIVTDALAGGSGGGAMHMAGGIVVPEGTIDLLSAADAGTGGAVLAVEVWYIPLDAGATIVAI